MNNKYQFQNQIFPVILQEDEGGGYVVSNPAIDGCYSQGDTIEEALENIKEATELCVEDSIQPTRRNIRLHLITLNNQQPKLPVISGAEVK